MDKETLVTLALITFGFALGFALGYGTGVTVGFNSAIRVGVDVLKHFDPSQIIQFVNDYA